MMRTGMRGMASGLQLAWSPSRLALRENMDVSFPTRGARQYDREESARSADVESVGRQYIKVFLPSPIYGRRGKEPGAILLLY